MAQSGGTGQKAIDAAGNFGSGVAGSGLTWLVTTLGISLDPALAKLLASGGFVVGVAFALVYRRYAAIITRRGPHERAAYDALRQSLVLGGLPARIYSERLRAVLDAVDRFVGDAGMEHRTLWPRAFGLRTPAPLWTAPAFNRCLLLAACYPIVTVVLLWTVTGHVGPAEQALHLYEGRSWLLRFGMLALVAFTGFAFWCGRRENGNLATIWYCAAGISLLAALRVGGTGAVATALVITAIVGSNVAAVFVAGCSVAFVLGYGDAETTLNTIGTIGRVVLVGADFAKGGLFASR